MSGVFERGTLGIVWLKLVKMANVGYCTFVGIWGGGAYTIYKTIDKRKHGPVIARYWHGNGDRKSVV